METQKMTAEEIIESLEYTAKFVPWSKSRSAKEKPELADYNLNWIVSIKRGQVEVSIDYMQGQGHIKGHSLVYGKRVCVDNAERIKRYVRRGFSLPRIQFCPENPYQLLISKTCSIVS